MKHLNLTLLVLTLLGGACARQVPQEGKAAGLAREEDALRSRLSALGYAAAPASQSPPAPTPPAPTPPGLVSNAADIASSLKLIRTATLHVEVADFATAEEEAAHAAASFGGYVSDRQSSDDEAGRRRGTITLRIPSDRFGGAISALKKLGKVRSEGVGTEDVTKAYADLETRLKVKRETATRLREILVRQTGKVSEVLEVEREIARVVGEIEQAEGERRYYDNLVALSTVTVSLFEPDSIVSPGALDPLLAALRQSARTASESLAAMILLGSASLPWLVALYVFYRFGRWAWPRRQKHRPQAE